MSRRSTRMNKSPANNTAKSVSQDELGSDFKPESDTSDPEFHAKVGRRNTTSTRKTVRKAPARRKRGKLRQMLDMPLDVILEICSHLLPRDLLNLARTSKALRSFFITRSSQSMWKAAFLNVPGLPPCPSDLSEPAYASLIFDAHCHGCWKKNCSNNRLHLELRTRLCETCMDGPGRRIVPIYAVPRDHKFELGKITGSHTLHDLLPAVYNSFFLETDIVELIKLLKEMPQEEHAKFLKARQQSILELRSHAESLQGWLDRSTASRGEELRELKASRKEAIIAKLQEDGWQGDLDYMKKDAGRPLRREFDNLPVVRKAQALTAKVWRNIKGPVTEFMQKVRETRIRAERKEILQHRLGEMREFVDHLPLRIPGCSISSIEIALCVPETSRLIDPDNPTFNPEDLEVPVRNFLQQRSQNAREKLRQCVIRDYGLDDSVDPFSLAVGSWFACLRYPCRSIMSLEQALNHRCYCGYNALAIDKPEHVNDEFYDLVRRRTEERIWTTAWYSSIPEVMLKVVAACGLDPKTATVDDLDRADVRLRCVCYAHRTINWRPIMAWRVAAANCARDGGLCDEFVRATEAEIAATKPLEATALALRERQWDADVKFLCRHCTAVSAYMTKAQVVVHIRDSHGIADPSESDWIDTHTTLKVPSPVWLVSEKLHDEPPRSPTSDWFQQGVATYFQF